MHTTTIAICIILYLKSVKSKPQLNPIYLLQKSSTRNVRIGYIVLLIDRSSMKIVSNFRIGKVMA